jgi:hypothetical protein
MFLIISSFINRIGIYCAEVPKILWRQLGIYYVTLAKLFA